MRGIMGYLKCPNCKETLKTTLLVEPHTVRKTARNKRQSPVEFIKEFQRRSPPSLERRCELFRVLGIYQRKDETERNFNFRLFEQINAATDETWKRLSETSQIWVNAACFAVEHKLPLPLP